MQLVLLSAFLPNSSAFMRLHGLPGKLERIRDHHSGVSCLTFGVELQSLLRHASWSWKFVHYYWRLQNSTSGMVINCIES